MDLTRIIAEIAHRADRRTLAGLANAVSAQRFYRLEHNALQQAAAEERIEHLAGCLAQEMTAKDRQALERVIRKEACQEARDALGHIRRTAENSRSQTRRLRFIAERARMALEGEIYQPGAIDLPKEQPTPTPQQWELRYRALKRERDTLAEAARVLEAFPGFLAGTQEGDPWIERTREVLNRLNPER
ncbi:MAG: hypothetical protein ACOC0M_00630 [Halomonas sp.]